MNGQARGRVGLWVCTGALAAGLQAAASPIIDGVVGGSEGWLLLTEAGHGSPVTGGNAFRSDAVGESSTFNWWDSANNVNRQFGDNRGDVINLQFARDSSALYLAALGPTVPFNSFDDTGGTGAEWDNDVGDLFLALDLSGGAASGYLAASNAITAFGQRAVDFLGWTPTHFIGVQYVDNGGGGGGRAVLTVSGTQVVLGDEGHGQNNGGFDWSATIGGGRSYDEFNGNAGEFEFRIPWTLLGFAGDPGVNHLMRFTMYTTQNFTDSDAFDSAPGLGNTTDHEAIGDNPGDPDSGGQLGPSDAGSFGQPGANFIGSVSGTPNHDDGVDTIEEFLIIPEPSTVVLLALGGIALRMARRRAQAAHTR